MNDNHDTNIKGIRKGYIDVFQEFMIENAEFDGYWEIPIIKPNVYRLPSKLIAYDQRKQECLNSKEVFIHFYIDDQKFDGPNGIWSGASKNFEQKRGFSIESIKKYGGIIGPDFSMGFGFPLSKQLDSVRRTRYFEHWMTSLGIQVIPNVRWTDERSYDFCFLGIPKNGIVAISTLGLMKYNISKKYFKLGLIELLKRVEPKKIIVYGKMPEDVFEVVDKTKVELINFESDISAFRGEK